MKHATKHHKRSADRTPPVELRPDAAPSVDLLPGGRVVFDWDGVSLILSAADARALSLRYLDAVMDGRDYFTRHGLAFVAEALEQPGA